MFNKLCEIVGCPRDPDKAASSMAEMALLGASILVNFDQWSYEHRIMLDKPNKWSNELEDIVNSGVLHLGQAAKVVCKFNFAVQFAHGRFGRAFLWPLIRCIHAPLAGYKLSE